MSKKMDWAFIEKTLFGVTIALIEGVIVDKILLFIGLPSFRFIPFWAIFLITWVIVMGCTYVIVRAIFYVILKTISYLKKTDPKNLILFYKLYPGEISLWIRNNEWRKKLKKVTVSIQYIYIAPGWEVFLSPDPTILRRCKQIELPSIKVDPQKQKFYINDEMDKVRFEPGKYKFSFLVAELCDKGDLLCTYFDMIVSYEGQDHIKVLTFGRRMITAADRQ